jgi:hypothetical protein
MPHDSIQTVLACAMVDTLDSNAPSTVVLATFVAERALDHYLTSVSNACLTQYSPLLDVTVRVCGVTLIVNRTTAYATPRVIYASGQQAPIVFSAGPMPTENREPENVSVTTSMQATSAKISYLLLVCVTQCVPMERVSDHSLPTAKHVGYTDIGRKMSKVLLS